MNELMEGVCVGGEQLQATIVNKWILSLLISRRLFDILFYSAVGVASLNW